MFERAGNQPQRAVDGLTLSAEAGECLVVVGPSGSGKTTLLRLIAGLETPTAGQIFLNGNLVNHLPPGTRDAAMVFQRPALYPHLSVRENLGLGLRLRGCPRIEADRRLAETVAAERKAIRGEEIARRPRAL